MKFLVPGDQTLRVETVIELFRLLTGREEVDMAGNDKKRRLRPAVCVR
jgi:hypothetical protein